MAKTLILILGVALFIIGGQDLIRILINPADKGIFGGFVEEYSARIILDIVLIIAGGFDVVYAKRDDTKTPSV